MILKKYLVNSHQQSQGKLLECLEKASQINKYLLVINIFTQKCCNRDLSHTNFLQQGVN